MPCVSNVAMENVLLVVSTDGVQMFIPTLTGTIVPRRVPAQLDADGVLIRIDAAEIRFSSAALTALMKHVFSARTDLSNIAVTTDGPNVVVSAKWHHIPVGFSASLTAVDGAIHLRPRHFASLYTNRITWDGGEPYGVAKNAAGDEIVLIPDRMIAPFIRISGALTAISVTGDTIVETFGSPSAARTTAALLRIDGGDVDVDGIRTSDQPFVRRADAVITFPFGKARSR